MRPGSPVELAVDTSNLHFFDLVSGLSIGHPQAGDVAAVHDGEAHNIPFSAVSDVITDATKYDQISPEIP